MYYFFGPLEWMRRWIVGGDEAVDRLPEFLVGGKARTLESVPRQKGEPYLNLVHPTGVGGDVVEMDVLVPRQPPVPLRLVGAQVVQDNVDLPAGMGAQTRFMKSRNSTLLRLW